MESIATKGIAARTGGMPSAASWRRAIALAPLLGLAAFLAYFVLAAWPHAELRPVPAAPSGGCALLLGYMAWPIGFALRAFGR